MPRRGERILLVAEDVESNTVVGTVQVVLAMPDNQPHRADVAKMQVHRSARRRGLGAALMRAAEAEAPRPGGHCWCWTPSAAATPSGCIPAWVGSVRRDPRLCVWPQGGLCDTTVFYRVLAE